jgi:shikimate kinase / 3-dehydroquinate synthase
MGAGKSTVGREVALLTDRRFLDTDAEIERLHGPIPALFERGEPEFRAIEEAVVGEALREPEPGVIALGGGAVLSEATRKLLPRRALTVWLQVDPETAWERVRGADRPLAQEEAAFRRLYEARAPVYADVADASATDQEDVLLAGLAVTLAAPATAIVVRADALVADERVLGLHPLDLGCTTYPVPAGEAAKRVEVARGLWETLELDRGDMLVAYGGGTTKDVAGFVAATYKRGVSWIAWPTTLVGQVDAAIGGKTGIDLDTGKNLVGAFHYPTEVLIDPELLKTLPDEERRAGMGEVVKTGLLAGRPLWELPDEEMVRSCAAFKAAVCLADPFEQTGRRAILNLGHTFAHALEAASGFELRHGDAVALGLLAALRLSGLETDVVDELLRPEPVPVDGERAWAALRRDKKAVGGRTRLVLLEELGKPMFPVELPDEDIRRELDALIAK